MYLMYQILAVMVVKWSVPLPFTPIIRVRIMQANNFPTQFYKKTKINVKKEAGMGPIKMYLSLIEKRMIATADQEGSRRLFVFE